MKFKFNISYFYRYRYNFSIYTFLNYTIHLEFHYSKSKGIFKISIYEIANKTIKDYSIRK